jgi:alpha-beta hydrolase superfamily lysophospholipase
MEPKASNGGAVILLHGIGDTRSGSTSHAEYLLQSGYTVLLPDSRDHGVSGGGLVTYGVQERDDVHRWADWLFRTEHPRRLYGLGESLGGSILLQALTVEPRFLAVIAECPYSTFRKIAYERVGRSFGMSAGVAPWLLWPVVEPAFLYARLRYGVNLNDASPEKAMGHTKVPILLVHGSADNATDPENSRCLRALNPDHVSLWEVPGAGHVGRLEPVLRSSGSAYWPGLAPTARFDQWQSKL